MSAPAKTQEVTKSKCNPDTLDAAFLAVARLSSGKGMGKDDVLGYVVALFLHIFATATIFVVTIAMRATNLQKARKGHVGAAFQTRMTSLTEMTVKNVNMTSPYFQLETNITTNVTKTGAAIYKAFDGLCSGEETHEWLHYMMFFLWISFIGPKIFQAFFRVQILVQIPSVAADAADQEITKKGIALAGIDCVSKLLIFVVVVLPHILTNVLAAWVGLQFLAMEASVATLLMKGLIMKMVTTIEAPVFKNFASKDMRSCMKTSTFVLPVQAASKRAKASMHYNTWSGPVIKFVVFFLVGFIYYKTQWTELITYRHMCSEVMAKIGSDSVKMRCIAQGIKGNTCGVN